MKIPIYQIDAFTSAVFSGNPAAVCPLENWLSDATMQAIAAENNLSETAFFVQKDDHFELRWFTPTTEIDLCGHATLASAWVIFNFLNTDSELVRFFSPRSGELTVLRENDLLKMDFPSRPPEACAPPADLVVGLGIKPAEVLQAEDYLAVFRSEAEIAALRPDFQRLGKLDKRGVIVTARGNDVDFVSRFFAPKLGVDEDPVTGSSHCTLIPYWKIKLKKNTFHARQVSARGGELFCMTYGDRVTISGTAVIYMQGMITI
ncbi:MAG: PhzF family phenazine biosynthesis protein [Pseudomonadota bacterium]